jgi:hypothetical protein
MSTTSTTTTNSRATRKSLAEQIERFDAILDGLADNLNEAVAFAVKEAVSAAVTAALQEVLTNADLLQRLRPEPVTRTGTMQGAAKTLCRGLVRLWHWASTQAEACQEIAGKVVSLVGASREALVRRVRRCLSGLTRRLWLGTTAAVVLARHFHKPLAIALSIGTVVGLGCYVAGPLVAALTSGMTSVALTLTAQALLPFGRLLVTARAHR